MAKRMAIVLSQSKGAGPVHRELEGTVVAELLMVHGLEVTLVPDLTTLGNEDTGLLCLEGITGDMVMLSWLDCVEAHGALAKLGIEGRSGRTEFSSESRAESGDAIDRQPNKASRTIYHIDLRSVNDLKACCVEIQRIRDEASVNVVDLGLGISVDPSRMAPGDVAIPASKASDTVSSGPAPVPPAQANAPTLSSDAEPADDDDEALDRLMQQFDACDD